MVGCANYSGPKAKPYESKQALPTSETDTKVYLTKIVNDVIASITGIANMLLIYQEDSITPTVDSKEALIQQLDQAMKTVEKNITYLESFTPAKSYEEKRDGIVSLCKDFKTNLKDIKKALNDNNFKELEKQYRIFEDFRSQLQTASL